MKIMPSLPIDEVNFYVTILVQKRQHQPENVVTWSRKSIDTKTSVEWI